MKIRALTDKAVKSLSKSKVCNPLFETPGVSKAVNE